VNLRMKNPKQKKYLLSRGNFCTNTSITDHTSSHKATDVVRAASALLTEIPPPLHCCIHHRAGCAGMLPSPCHRSHSHTSAAPGNATTVGVLLHQGRAARKTEQQRCYFGHQSIWNWGNAEQRSELSSHLRLRHCRRTRGYTSESAPTSLEPSALVPNLRSQRDTAYLRYFVIVVERNTGR
jgi:hypothetical protein